MILFTIIIHFSFPVYASTGDHIEIVDSVENPRFTDISIITTDNIKETIRTDNRRQEKRNNHNKIEENKDTRIENILLVGIDSRNNSFKYARADTIIIASIDKLEKQVKLTSIMRDTYVKIPGHRNNRINAAYAFGGIELLKETINKNFNLGIEKHIVINFKGFEEVIDILDGVDVDIKDYEVRELNRCLTISGKSRKNYLNQSGKNHLNGQQALAYCRIRKVGNDDYERTERQRKVISLIIDKANRLSISEYPKLIANIYPHVKTNIDYKECLKLVYDYYRINNWAVESIQIPSEQSGKPKIINSMWVIDPDIEECIKCIKEFIY